MVHYTPHRCPHSTRQATHQGNGQPVGERLPRGLSIIICQQVLVKVLLEAGSQSSPVF
ncbi:MAG: hypothetical protein J5I90_08360 [Caldilineales bacterium]|nr:hypothetical protein [Caldilineales bacterium]